MKNNISFKLMLSANGGNKKARWEIIESLSDEIVGVSEQNKEMENTIFLDLFDLFDVLDKRFEEYVKC